MPIGHKGQKRDKAAEQKSPSDPRLRLAFLRREPVQGPAAAVEQRGIGLIASGDDTST